MLLALLSPRVRFGGAVKWVSVGLLLELCGHVQVGWGCCPRVRPEWLTGFICGETTHVTKFCSNLTSQSGYAVLRGWCSSRCWWKNFRRSSARYSGVPGSFAGAGVPRNRVIAADGSWFGDGKNRAPFAADHVAARRCLSALPGNRAAVER